MKSLIRFEDTYGLLDVFTASRNIPYMDINKLGDRLIQIDNDTFIDFGLGQGWSSITHDEVYAIIELGIEQIILVYDVDNENGDKSNILSKQQLDYELSNLESRFSNNGYAIDIRCVQLVYAAETILLHQELLEYDGIHIENFVHTIDTNELHLDILANLLGYSNRRRAKRVRDYLDIARLKTGLNNIESDRLNYITANWIINNFNTNNHNLMSKFSVLKHLLEIENNFKYWQKRASDDKRHLIIKDKTNEKIFYFYKSNR